MYVKCTVVFKNKKNTKVWRIAINIPASEEACLNPLIVFQCNEKMTSSHPPTTATTLGSDQSLCNHLKCFCSPNLMYTNGRFGNWSKDLWIWFFLNFSRKYLLPPLIFRKLLFRWYRVICYFKNGYISIKNSFKIKEKTSLPYFGVKLSCVCLMFAYRKK